MLRRYLDITPGELAASLNAAAGEAWRMMQDDRMHKIATGYVPQPTGNWVPRYDEAGMVTHWVCGVRYSDERDDKAAYVSARLIHGMSERRPHRYGWALG